MLCPSYFQNSSHGINRYQPNFSQTPADLPNIFLVWCGGPNISRPIQPDSTLPASKTKELCKMRFMG